MIKEYQELIDRCDYYEEFTKDEIIALYSEDLEFMYIYYYLKSLYGNKDFYLFYKKGCDRYAHLEIGMYVIFIGSDIRFIEILNGRDVSCNTDDIKIAMRELNKYD